MEDFALIFFIADTYEKSIPEEERERLAGANVEEGEVDEGETGSEARGGKKRGRKRNERSHYLPDHSKHDTHYRIVRTPGHNTIPSARGEFYPTHTDPETMDFFRASMLTLCKPWRSLQDLKGEYASWEEAYDSFLEHAPKRIHHIISGVKYHYDSRSSAQQHRDANTEEMEREPRRRRRNQFEDVAEDLRGEGEEDENIDVDLNESEHQRLARAIEELGNSREEVHGKAALQIARQAGIFATEGGEWRTEGLSAGLATGDDYTRLERWQAKLKACFENSEPSHPMSMEVDEGSVSVGLDTGNPHVEHISPEELGVGEMEMTSIDPSCLFAEQRRAYDIVNYHLGQTLDGRKPPQLLMHVPGEGGVGKSKVIQTITDQFAAAGASDRLLKAAYTGIAASLIGGSTIHVICRIPPPRAGSRKDGEIVHSPEVEKDLAEKYSNKKYLILDEVSMVSRELMREMSRVIGKARAGLEDYDPQLPFGGLNVIIFGDMHQFPPVTGGAPHALFTPIRPRDFGRKDMELAIQGRRVYEQFDTVVKLRKQVRVVDERWRQLLSRARHGNCGADDLRLLRRLILTKAECPPTDFNKGPWSEAVLVTPRHAVRRQWNEAAVERHCRLQKVTQYTSVALDAVKGRQLTASEEFLMMKKKSPSLASRVQLAIGMKCMVTFNVNTEQDIANGSRGTVYGIVLDEREEVSEGPKVTLKYPPAYVLVKLDRTKAPKLDGLPEGVVPIVPIRKDFYINVGRRRVKVTRIQLPITPAYAFTDYRSQGQTIEYVIVDIGWPPSGGLTAFNAYVALSRSSGAATIRLLRDFDNDLFTQHPNEDLRMEDRRLEELDHITWARWNVIFEQVKQR